MKILCLWEKPSGVEYHRIIKPMQRVHIDNPEIEVFFKSDYLTEGLPEFKEFDLVIFNRWLYDYTYPVLEYLAKNNIPYIVDIDDYWKIPKHHPMKDIYRKSNIGKITEDIIRYANGVTTTCEPLAAKIRAVNPKVKIIPNALDTTDEQWNWQRSTSDKFRFGYVAGFTHYNDAQLIGEAISEVLSKNDNAEFWYVGYDNNEYCRSILKRLNNNESVMKINARGGDNPDKYGRMFADLDCIIAPLEDTFNNNCKSDIKVQEAKAYGLPIIASDVLPYNDCDGVLLVPNTTHDWAAAMQMVLDKRLQGDTNCRSIEDMNAKRIEFFKWVLNSTIKDPT